MGSNDLWMTIQGSLAAAVENWLLRRTYAASLFRRKEGFTECWGEKSYRHPVAEIWTKEQQSVQLICATEHPQEAVRLVQYRPAWLEQLALRIGRIPHVVINAPYATTETTGPLPYIMDLGQQNAVLTGRRNPHRMNENSILLYLKETRNIDLDEPMGDSVELQQKSSLYQSWIQHDLNPFLAVLRFQDFEAWEQIYRAQCLQAASGGRAQKWTMFASWQAWAERVTETYLLGPHRRACTTSDAIRRIREIYRHLDDELKSKLEHDSYLLGTATPTLVDALLWDHLMHALTDVYLVVVMSDFSALIQYTQKIWDVYFAKSADSVDDWQKWNAEQNARNVFCQVQPLRLQTKDKVQVRFRDAINLMEHLSVESRNLEESLLLAREARVHIGERTAPAKRPFYTWYRWRMGDSYLPPPDHFSDRHFQDIASQQEEKSRREYRRNDEVWLATVTVGTLAAALFFGAVGTTNS